MIYLDDILVYSQTREEHLCQLRKTLQRVREHQLYAQLHKCEFLVDHLEYLGHVIDRDGIKVSRSTQSIGSARLAKASNDQGVAVLFRIS